jgi:DNA recombination protein RmuC
LENDEQLFEYAWDKRIVIVSPTTLMATLRTIASIWKYEKQNRNVQEISKLANSLIAKFRNFMKNFDRIEQQLEKSMDSYAEARKQLSLGNGNVLRTLDKIRDKSGDTTKLLPDGFDEEMAKAEEEGGDVKRLEDES